MTETQQVQQQPQKSWFGRNCIWVVPVGCGLPILACGGFITVIVVGVFGMIKSSEPYQEALAAAQSNQAVIEIIGEPVEAKLVVGGSINVSGDASGDADINFGVSGPNGSGTVYVAGTKSGGQWSYSTMRFAGPAGEEVDLLYE